MKPQYTDKLVCPICDEGKTTGPFTETVGLDSDPLERGPALGWCANGHVFYYFAHDDVQEPKVLADFPVTGSF